MSRLQRHRRPILVAVLCALVGAAAGIAGTAAAPKQSKSAAAARDHRGGPHGRFHGPPVHVEAVVLNKAGDAFIKLTEDSGTVKSVDSNELTITEGFKDVTYKDVTLTIPSDATVMRNFNAAKLSDLKAGDRVHVESSSEGTNVFAVDPDQAPPRGPRGGHFRRGHGPDGPPF